MPILNPRVLGCKCNRPWKHTGNKQQFERKVVCSVRTHFVATPNAVSSASLDTLPYFPTLILPCSMLGLKPSPVCASSGRKSRGEDCQQLRNRWVSLYRCLCNRCSRIKRFNRKGTHYLTSDVSASCPALKSDLKRPGNTGAAFIADHDRAVTGSSQICLPFVLCLSNLGLSRK